MERVLVICITKDLVDPMGFESIINQDYKNFRFIVHAMKPDFYSSDPAMTKHINCSANRNEARKVALSYDADWFLFIDSDMVFPKNTISSLMKQTIVGKLSSQMKNFYRVEKDLKREHRVIGGWYRQSGGVAFVGGVYVADYTFQHYYAVHPGLVQTDMVGMGCVLMHREVLSNVKFRDGMNMAVRTTIGTEVNMGECMSFSSDCLDKGYGLYLSGDVVCTHNPRRI